MKIKIAIGVLVFILIAFYSLTQINFLDYESPKKYYEIEKITFNDFKGLEFFQKSLYGNKQFAYIKTSINYKIGNDSLKVESLFHPSSSYVYNKNAFSKELLTHELYHFKITELYVRMIKKKVADLKIKERAKIEGLINEFEAKERRFQLQYDDDTFHSYVFNEQKKYENSIDSLLNLHSNFKNPKVYINEK